jgi:succinoglycan biosynthesis transport protein ExoP
MLNAAPFKRLDMAEPNGTLPDGGDSIDLQGILRFLRRRAPIIAAVTAALVAIGFVYSLIATPRYTATASVLVDNSTIKSLRDQTPTNDSPVSVTIDSQVEIIKSERVLQRAAKDIDLANDPVLRRSPGLLTKLKNAVSAIVAPHEITKEEGVDDEFLVDWLHGHIDVRRVGLTNVIHINATSENPDTAARVANAVAEAYLSDIHNAKREMGENAVSWLQDRLKQLSEQTSESDRAVQKFKLENNIVSTGKGGLLNEQQIGEISSQIILARAQVAEAKARWDRVEQILKGDASDATVTESLRNDVIVRLRQQFLEVARREAELSARYGSGHMAAVNLRNEKKQLLDNIKDELRRIAQSYKSDYEIAKLRETTLQKSLDEIVSKTSQTNQAQVKLREMESAVHTSREVQENFLKKYMELAQSFPVTEARIISAAKTPRYKSWPSVTKITAGAAVLGLILGLIFSLGLEAMDTTFRTPSQVEDALGARVLGVLPKIVNPKLPYRTLHADGFPHAGPYGKQLLGEDLGSLRYAVENPLSHFAETLRHVKFEASANPVGAREGKVIGICSTKAGEGKSFVAVNFAELIADAGQRCVLVDCDLRYPALTYMLSPEAVQGLADVIRMPGALDGALWTDSLTRMSFLPAASQRRMHHPHELLASDGLAVVIEELRRRYDFVVLDLPPATPFADVRAMSQVVDAFVYVIEWGATSRDAVAAALRGAPVIREKLLGCLLNKADVTKLSRYDRSTDSDYYARYSGAPAYRPDLLG